MHTMNPLRAMHFGAAWLALAATTGAAPLRHTRAEPLEPQQRESTRMSAEVSVELVLPRAVRAGDTVAIILRARNTGSRAADLMLPGRPPAFDIVVTTRDGTEVWRRLRGASISAALGVRTLQPGESLDLATRWPQRDNAGRPVSPGTYEVRGVLPTEERPLSTQARELVIAP